MSAKPETAVYQSIISWLQERGGDAFKVYGNQLQRGGEPDLDGQYYSERLGRWLHLKIECKYGDGKPDPRQEMRLKVYALRGYVTISAWGVSDVIKAIDLYENEHANENHSSYISEIAQLRLWISRIVAVFDNRTPFDAHGTLRSIKQIVTEMKTALDWL